jgi:hypothetical protein
MASKIKGWEWKGLFVVTGFIDAVQFFGDLFLTEAAFAPEIVSEVVDPAIGILLCLYFELRGVQIVKQPKRLFSLLGITGVEELTGGLAPAWTLDVWYIYRNVKSEEAAQKANQEQMRAAATIRQTLNQEGRREPAPSTQTASSGGPGVTRTIRPLNVDGVRIATNTSTSTASAPTSKPKTINTNETLAA